MSDTSDTGRLYITRVHVTLDRQAHEETVSVYAYDIQGAMLSTLVKLQGRYGHQVSARILSCEAPPPNTGVLVAGLFERVWQSLTCQTPSPQEAG